ncbi:PREDICTED: ankyrin repeat, SAM and basic leucine zipper domain-containing protein 1 isoform X2 [Wasmannia auropunctata]|uniref:ankyrin repeat, SAM and basic leucine zipper domain-containing protein 1 isoform X2 n=1 Tax=Wasmannia auropunctata TaxID=64793 RepID=UPI0005EE8B45|nr:PREDICTED: ankyrin repeat, SAM and basic leucine zipper domain-containing protein 1 isoform X2 [Wasmannia auropunctata]
MSQYRGPRPGGMSDEEDEYGEDDDVFFPVEEKESVVKERTPWKEEGKKETRADDLEVATYNDNDERTQRDYEDRVVKACTMGHLAVVQEYVEQHDVNNFLYTGWTVLLYATSSLELEIVEYLLTHGANPNKHKDGFTPLMALCNSTKATTEKSLKCLELLVKANADANAINKRRETALMYACMSQSAEFVSELIKYVHDVNACDSDGKTALSYAAAANQPDIVKILLSHNAHTSLTDKDGSSAKDIADAKGFTEISALLDNNEEEVLNHCEISEMDTWKNFFPSVYPKKKEVLHLDVSIMLYGMGLEQYAKEFQGMDIKTFLQLTEDDLCQLGIDITVHRKDFLDSLEKFHSRRIYDGIVSLTNAKKQIGVIASSFQYLRNNLVKTANEKIYMRAEKKEEYEEKLRKTQETLKRLKKEIVQIKKLAHEIDKEDDMVVPPTWIGPESKHNLIIAIDRTVTISITLMVGLYLCRNTYVQRLWNMCNIRLFSLLRFT